MKKKEIYTSKNQETCQLKKKKEIYIYNGTLLAIIYFWNVQGLYENNLQYEMVKEK